MKVLRLHWTLHPDKDLAWYEDQCSRMTEDEVARELDLNLAMSVSGRVFSSFKRYKHVIHKFEPKKSFPIIRIWDFGHTNATLYMQIDHLNRKRIWHERVIGKMDDGASASNTVEMAQQAMVDSDELFHGFEFIDICDPQGKVDGTSGRGSSDLEVLQKEFNICPNYQTIISLPTRHRKKRGIGLIQKDLQYSPGGEEAFQMYISPDGDKGCPILQKAFESAYTFKKDAQGNFTDQIVERHPFEDVVDCLIYGYIEEAIATTANDPAMFEPAYDIDHYSDYLGY